MKALTLAVWVLLSIGSILAQEGAFPTPTDLINLDMGSLWKQFKGFFGKTYDKAEDQLRFDIFTKSVRDVVEMNVKSVLNIGGAKFGINEFSDWTPQEFKKMLGLKMPKDLEEDDDDKPTKINVPFIGGNPFGRRRKRSAEFVDWSSHMSPVKSQGSCGSCWAFTSTAVLEGFTSIKHNKKVVLSEQNLIDCASGEYNNDGCDGGTPNEGFKYIRDNNGIDSTDCYKYETRNGDCRYNVSCNSASLSGYVKVGRNEEAMKMAIEEEGPLAIGMDAGQRDFGYYSSGIYDNRRCSSRNVNHAVTIVGYGTEHGKDYWLVRNSWGSNWGLKGYFKIARGSKRCGVQRMPSHVNLG